MDEQTDRKPAGSATQGVTGKVEAEFVQFGPGFAGLVSVGQDAVINSSVTGPMAAGHDMTLSNGGAGVVAVGRDLTLSDGGCLVMIVGNTASLEQGGALVVRAGGNAEINQGGSLVISSHQVSAYKSTLGVVLARRVEVADDSQVMISTPQALALGAAFGLVFGLLRWLLKRR